jgi:branched-chain amino acid transport system permease protein
MTAAPASASAQADRVRLAGLALLIVLACVLPFVVSNYRVLQFTLAMVYAIALLGLNMLTGLQRPDLARPRRLLPIGAYTAAILMDRFGAPYWLTVPAAGCRVPARRLPVPACRRCAWRACTWRWPPSPSASRCRRSSSTMHSKHLDRAGEGIVIVRSPTRRSGGRLTQDQWLYFVVLGLAVVLLVLRLEHACPGASGRGRWLRSATSDRAQAMGVNTAMDQVDDLSASRRCTPAIAGLGGDL